MKALSLMFLAITFCCSAVAEPDYQAPMIIARAFGWLSIFCFLVGGVYEFVKLQRESK